jgi:hypothetical protein
MLNIIILRFTNVSILQPSLIELKRLNSTQIQSVFSNYAIAEFLNASSF